MAETSLGPQSHPAIRAVFLSRVHRRTDHSYGSSTLLAETCAGSDRGPAIGARLGVSRCTLSWVQRLSTLAAELSAIAVLGMAVGTGDHSIHRLTRVLTLLTIRLALMLPDNPFSQSKNTVRATVYHNLTLFCSGRKSKIKSCSVVLYPPLACYVAVAFTGWELGWIRGSSSYTGGYPSRSRCLSPQEVPRVANVANAPKISQFFRRWAARRL